MSNIATVKNPVTSEPELVHLVRSTATIQVRYGEVLLASTQHAVELHEADVPTRYYIPREDVRVELLAPIEHTTFCPFKGVASDYWALAAADDDRLVAWSYPIPFPAFDDIAGYIAFYDWVTITTND